MAFDQLLKRNFWVAILGLTGVAALLDAQGVTQLVGVGLGADDKQLSAPPLVARVAPSAAATGGHETNAGSILSRNPFDSVTGPLNRVATPPEDSAALAPPDMSDPRSAPQCDGVKVLIIAASADPDWSFATFSGDKGKSIMRRRGGDVGTKTVKFVGWDRVWMCSTPGCADRGPAVGDCQAEMFKPAAPAASAAPSAAPMPAPAGGGAGAVSQDIAKGVVKVGPTEFNVDRGVVDKILENQAELMRQARIVPEQENGKTVGIRLYGVRPDTLLGVLGMENGDRLEKINGFEMASPEKALEAYARLRTADHLTVGINRRGQTMNLDYNIK